MVLPFGAIAQAVEVEIPPSQYVLSKRPLMLAILLLQFLTSCTRFYDFGLLKEPDFMGAFFCFVGCSLGWLAYIQHMDLQFILYWGLFGFYLSIIELLKCIQLHIYLSKHPDPSMQGFINGQRSFGHNVLGVLYLLCPVVFLWGSVLSYLLYSNYHHALAWDSLSIDAFDSDILNSPVVSSPGRPSSPGRLSSAGGHGCGSSYSPFAGKGVKLGSSSSSSSDATKKRKRDGGAAKNTTGNNVATPHRDNNNNTQSMKTRGRKTIRNSRANSHSGDGEGGRLSSSLGTISQFSGVGRRLEDRVIPHDSAPEEHVEPTLNAKETERLLQERKKNDPFSEYGALVHSPEKSVKSVQLDGSAGPSTRDDRT